MNVVNVQGLRKTYGTVKAVDGVSFSVDSQEVFGLLGPNGAGKTTTIECIAGLRTLDEGSITVLGIDPSRQRKALYQRIGVQLQETSFQDKIRVYELCGLFSSFYPHPIPFESLLTRFSLMEKKNAYVQNLSGGQRQRLSIILALISNPEVIVLDELTTGLDPQSRRDMWAYIQQLKQEGRTVLITTHYMEEAEYLCDRIGIIDQGALIAYGTVEEVIQSCGLQTKITFETSEDVSNILVDRIPEISDIQRAENRYSVMSPDDGVLGKVAYLLEDRKIRYQKLDVQRPNLDDVFLQLTGRTIEEHDQ